ncbi:DUF4267 domain-containing protein [Kribbella sp. NPDC048915]|uniref:DUF4267 domain-containing protein n=1 Tax=Kribbella sp. NPDC048915 TaxID=3155148 RepID=UPI0034067C35
MRRFTSVLTVLIGIFPLTFGTRFLIDGAAAAAGFGVDPGPIGAAAAYFPVKGIRDIALGLVVLALFALGQRRATGVVLAILAIIPTTDMIVVLTHSGSAAVALGIHGMTALVILVNAVLLLREPRVVEALQPAHS